MTTDKIVSIDFDDDKPKKNLIRLPKILRKSQEPQTELSEFDRLEAEIEQKKKVLAIKRKEEEIRKQERFIAEQKASVQEQERIKVPKNVDVPLTSIETFDLKTCPQCHRRFRWRGLIKGKVRREGNEVIQIVKCRDKNCSFSKVIILEK